MKNPEKLNLLLVDDEDMILDLYKPLIQLVFKKIDVLAYVVCVESADAAVDELTRNKYEYNGVVVDGLFGECWRVTDAAVEQNTPVVVHSGSLEIVDTATDRGILAAVKGQSREGFSQILVNAFYRS